MNKPEKLSKTGLLLPSAEEDAAIARGIAADPDTLELTASLAARLQPLGAARSRGRPLVGLHPKVPVTMRVDADVLEAIKATGAGWQTRVNQLLRDAVQRGKFAA